MTKNRQIIRVVLKEAERVWGKMRYKCRRYPSLFEAGKKDENGYFQKGTGNYCVQATSWYGLLEKLKSIKEFRS